MRTYDWQYVRNGRDDRIVYQGEERVDRVKAEMPHGWYFRLVQCGGMLDIINDILEQYELETYFRIDQIKEKWGQLEFYYHFKLEAYEYHEENVEKAKEQLDVVIQYMQAVSKQVCIVCGKNEAMMEDVNGWDSPYCNEHTRGIRY